MSRYTDPASLDADRARLKGRRHGAVAAQERAEVMREDESTPRSRSALDAIWGGRSRR